jgi:thioredoxin reductase
MAELNQPPFPPGRYPVLVIGSGPGALQTAYFLKGLGIESAVLSADDAPGGMFRRFPVFQRLITWSKPHAPVEAQSRRYEWFDWNSLLSEDPDQRALIPAHMDGTSYFPSRSEMERGLVGFAQHAGIDVRYGCRWEGTRIQNDGFVLSTSEGDYGCRVVVFAVGMAQPWKPEISGIDSVPHYVDIKPIETYAGKRVFLIGKRNSGFELADGLLAHARQIILGSPRPARISVLARSTAAARARYLQPYEDHVLGGGNVVLDVSINRIERTSTGYRVRAQGTSKPGDFDLEVDEVIAATGFQVPLGDLPDLGVTTFYQGRLPAQTPFWESVSVPGIYFAGAITQGSIGLKKYGVPSNSAAVHGFRYNARVLVSHIAHKHFGIQPETRPLRSDEVLPFLLAEATTAPELWNQQSYLARELNFADDGIVDAGITPLAHFVDADGPDAVAVTVETDPDGEIRPAAYVRRRGRVSEHTLPSDPLNRFDTGEHRANLASILEPLIGP